MILPGFRHHPGHHCGSTALRNLAVYHGLEVTEAMCFGLGAGLGFVYVESEATSPTRLLMPRAPELERTFFHHLGVDFEWRSGLQFPWPAMAGWLDAGVPVLILCDLRHLDYYNTRTHFSGHSVVLAGYDPAPDRVYLADTGFEGLQEVPLTTLARAMVSPHPPFPVRNHWREVPSFVGPAGPPVAVAGAARRALLRAARAMLEPPDPAMGVAGLKRLAEAVRRWGEAPDWSWCARFAYQVIERRGTGGSAFRRLYAEFVAECEALATSADGEPLAGLAGRGLGEAMAAIARRWTDLAEAFKAVAEGDDPGAFASLGPLVADLVASEEQWCRTVLAALG